MISAMDSRGVVYDCRRVQWFRFHGLFPPILSPDMPLLTFSKDMVLELGASIKYILLMDS
jgi:hypothetical protein